MNTSTSIATTTHIGIPGAITEINKAAIEKVNAYLPELIDKTKSFLGRQNTQSTITMMTLTLLGGQSAFRMLRTILAEVETKKEAVCGLQLSHAKLLASIENLKDKTDEVSRARYNQAVVSTITAETQINNVLKDIATLIDAYNSIKEVNNIGDWDEVAFEASEKRHHVRRCFEMMYRNLVSHVGQAGEATLEYCQQYGIHPQVCKLEVQGYIKDVASRIETGEMPHSNDLEDFLDNMADKYIKNPDKTCERLFGKSSIANHDYMYKTVTK